jgi:hypothetical protein
MKRLIFKGKVDEVKKGQQFLRRNDDKNTKGFLQWFVVGKISKTSMKEGDRKEQHMKSQ